MSAIIFQANIEALTDVRELAESHKEILFKLSLKPTFQKNLVDNIGTKSSISRTVTELQQMKLLFAEQKGRDKILKLTSYGKDAVRKIKSAKTERKKIFFLLA